MIRDPVPAGAVLQTAVLRAQGREVRYHIRASRRARRIGITVRADAGVIVTLPVRAKTSEMEAFLQRHEAWILRQLDRLQAVAARVPRRWPYGPTLPLRGQEREVSLIQGVPQRVSAINGTLEVVARRPGIESARRLLRRWFVEQAREACLEAVRRWAPRLGVDWAGMSIGGAKSRWGSCSVKGRLRFNYRLVMAPPDVLEYVVVHELAHRKELNHSKRFWKHVERHAPHHKQARRWLATYGPHLGIG